MHLTLLQWLAVVPCAFGLGLSKGGIPGIGILPIAIFALVIPASASVGMVLPLLICGDVMSVSMYRRHAVWAHLTRLLPWAALGIVGGFLMLHGLQLQHYDRGAVDHQVGRMIGVILMVLVALHVWRHRKMAGQSDQEAQLIPGNLWIVAAVGVIAGFTTMVANAAGPIMVIYMLSMRLQKLQFIGTTAWYFLLLNLFKVPFMALLGWINADSLTIDLALAPAVVFGVLSGRLIITRINQRVFEATALSLTLLAALRMLM